MSVRKILMLKRKERIKLYQSFHLRSQSLESGTVYTVPVWVALHLVNEGSAEIV